ncbi:Nitrilotriacetate monooxygenase component A [Rhodococcus sp. 66b]|nr:Nitrilotriacetate monooxygenase component A [Rhodococcus sp. 66b]
MTVFAVGIELDGEGTHPAAWRRSSHRPDQLLTGKAVRDRVAAAENAGFTFATFDDSILPPSGDVVGRIDAVSRASYVAATTSTIGLVPVVGTTYAEPFHTSSQLATLDYSSRGRGGWLAVPVEDDAAARAWGRAPVTTESARQQEQRDSVTVVTDLWDSWEDDAVVRDYLSGRFLERDRLHYVNFEGDTFSVKGPSIVPRPPQGQWCSAATAPSNHTRPMLFSFPVIRWRPLHSRLPRRAMRARHWWSPRSMWHSIRRICLRRSG